MASPEWGQLATSTRADRRRYLEALVRSTGEKPFDRLEPRHVRAFRDERAAHPEAANTLLKALKALFKWATAAGHARHDPTLAVPKLRHRTEGYHTWTPEEVRQYLTRWGPGTRQRLALTLLLYTGARKGDVLRMGPQMVRDGALHFTTGKTGTPTTLPILPPLAAELARHPTIAGPWLRTSYGKPFTPSTFGKRFREWANEAGVPGSAHGIRKAAASLAAENGATEAQLNAIFGWGEGSQEARRYTRAADRQRLAAAGAQLISVPPNSIGTASSGKAS